MYRDRLPIAQGINTYVKAMQYATGLVHGQPAQFLLGSPAASNATAIGTALNAQATVGQSNALGTIYVSDSPYGRTLIVTPSGNPGNSAAIDVYGFDYLGQPMVERFTGASGSTAVLYGRKAFYRVTRWVDRTAATNAVTWSIGTGTRLGLPYKGDLVYAQENGVFVEFYKRPFIQWFDRAAAEAVAGSTHYFRSPCPGYVNRLMAQASSGGGANNPVFTVQLGGVAITGLSTTLVDATPGTVVSSTPTTPGYNANNLLATGSVAAVVATAAAAATGDRVGLEIIPTQFTYPDLTDPGTNGTGDPRGTYDPLTAPAGVPIVVALHGDQSVNANNNGGLHGIQHFFG